MYKIHLSNEFLIKALSDLHIIFKILDLLCLHNLPEAYAVPGSEAVQYFARQFE